MGMRAESTADLATLLAQAGWLRRFARALVGDAAAADDLAQDTMVSALRRPAQGGGRAWLATVARNLAVDRFRGTTRRERREDAAQVRDPSAGRVASPEDLIADAEIHRQVAEAVTRLSEPFRQTVVLRFYEGFSSAEIARSLGQPEGTIRWRLKEALDRVRAELDSRYDDDRSAWRAALAPLVAAPPSSAPRAASSGPRPARGSATAAPWAAGVAAVAIFSLAVVVAVALAVGRRAPPSDAREVARSIPPPSSPASPPSATTMARVGLPGVDLPNVDPSPGSDRAAAAPTPGRPDAESLAEELLAALASNDYDAFVAKGSPSFRVALDPARLEAASAAVGGRLSRGHRVSTLGNVHRRHTVDWLFKIEFDDTGDDTLCTLAMDGWQVAGFLVTEPIPHLSESDP